MICLTDRFSFFPRYSCFCKIHCKYKVTKVNTIPSLISKFQCIHSKFYGEHINKANEQRSIFPKGAFINNVDSLGGGVWSQMTTLVHKSFYRKMSRKVGGSKILKNLSTCFMDDSKIKRALYMTEFCQMFCLMIFH